MLRKILLTGLIVGLLCGIGTGAERSPSDVPGPDARVLTDRLVFSEKGDDFLLFCKRRFDVTPYTLIKDASGMVISFDQITVPCEAMVRYYRKPQKRNRYVAVSIEVAGKPVLRPE